MLSILIVLLFTAQVYGGQEPSFGEAIEFEDQSNWQSGRKPTCNQDRIILPEKTAVIINSLVQLRELVLPQDGLLIFGDNAELAFFEQESRSSCMGQDVFLVPKQSISKSNSSLMSSVMSFLYQLFVDVMVFLTVCFVILGVYLNRTQGFTLLDTVSFIRSEASSRLSSFYLPRPPEGTFNFIRFQGTDDLEMEMGSSVTATAVTSSTYSAMETSENYSDDDGCVESMPPTSARSLRNVGYLMSEIKEDDEEIVEESTEPKKPEVNLLLDH